MDPHCTTNRQTLGSTPSAPSNGAPAPQQHSETTFDDSQYKSPEQLLQEHRHLPLRLSVPLRVGALSYKETKAIVLIVWISAALGVAGTVILVVLQYVATANVYFLEHTNFVIANLVVCSVLMLVMTVVSITYTWQLVRVGRRLPKGIRYASNAVQETAASA